MEEFRGPGADEDIVLINPHGGAFLAGAKYISRAESIPAAHLGRLRVVSAIATAKPAPQSGDGPVEEIVRGRFGYLPDTDPGDPLVAPAAAAPEVLAEYPPALFITGTRSFDLSPAIAFHRALVKALGQTSSCT